VRLFPPLAGAVLFGACTSEAPPPDAQVGETSADAIAPEWCETLPRPGYASLDRVTIDSDWFEAWDVGEGVIAIYEPRQWQEIISYLVLGSERALLFDTGMGIASISDVVRQLTELPVTVLNSHTHLDHIGGNAEFNSIIAMDTDFTRGRSVGLSNQQVREELAPEALCGPLPAGVTQDSYVTRPWTITEVATDGHTIDLGGRLLQVLHIPGHTPDAIALRRSGYSPRRRTWRATRLPSPAWPSSLPSSPECFRPTTLQWRIRPGSWSCRMPSRR